ncbi:MAG: DUF1653 domain-containing protein [Butyrivibrio sp.]|nr:DUF1653 domain-containing protein [Butyrivibrio sp.]
MLKRPAPQELYRHFKGGKYQIITVAKDADTGEDIVVYQALYGNFTVYCRSLKEFMSEVDHVKYPNADQKMRFERFEVSKADDAALAKEDAPAKDQVLSKSALEFDRKFSFENEGAAKEETASEGNANYMQRTIEEEAEEFGMNPLVVKFLDADSSSERLEILNQLRPIITNEMIDVMAMAIDTEVPGDDPDLRCVELKECLITKQRFEVTRLRK